MRTSSRFSFLLLAALSPVLAAQQAPASSSMTLDVAVTTKPGTPVPGLTQQDFSLLVGKHPEPITSFQAVDHDQPVKVILIVDNISIVQDTLASLRGQVVKFFRANERLPSPTSLAIMTDNGTSLEHTFTTDGHLLADNIATAFIQRRTNHDPGKAGAVQRFQQSLNTLGQLIARQQGLPGRKVFLWISPGWPVFDSSNEVMTAAEQRNIFGQIVALSNGLRQNSITLYQVNPLGVAESFSGSRYYDQFTDGVAKPSDSNIGNLSLQVLTLQSGGLVLSSNNIAEMLSRCYADINTFYRVTFTPPPSEHPEQYHPLEVHVDRPGLTVRTRAGYYSAP